MTREHPAISVDQVTAFVELAHTRSIRLAADSLHLSEEGLRGRLLALEQRLGVTLYEKAQGRRSGVRLSHAGENFLRKATKFVDDARTLAKLDDPGTLVHELTIAASQYVTYYLLIDIVKEFHAASTDIAIRIMTRTEDQVLDALQSENTFSIGICAPDEYPTNLLYRNWFTMEWALISQIDGPEFSGPEVTLEEISRRPLILFEPGSTGRQHILEAFYNAGLTPKVAMEATTTSVIVRMVEAGLGVSLVPVLRSGAVTRGLNVRQLPISQKIRPLHTGIFVSPACRADDAVTRFSDFLLGFQP